MVSFVVYDLTFLVAFCIFVAIFLYKKRKNLGRESMLGIPVFLYRTKLGMKFIDYIGGKYKKTLHVVKFVSITLGFLLMAAMVYILGKTLYIYAAFPQITQVIKAPPIAPLIPYFPTLFGVESFFPPFYFTYFIVAILIVAVVHEFSHGIYMKLFNIKIKSTGFAFFGPLLGAFVEEDRNQFVKKKKIAQMSVLSAGVFANIIFALIFFGLLVGFFYLSFTPSGYIFNSYAYSYIPVSQIISISNYTGNLTQINTLNQTFYLDNTLKVQLDRNLSVITAYDNSPAFISNLAGVITEVNGIKINNQKSLSTFMANTKPGELVYVTTMQKDSSNKVYNLSLGINPTNNSMGYLGIANLKSSSSGLVARFVNLFTSFRDSSTYYAPAYGGGLPVFMYNLLWWVMIINFLVGLFNMLPLGILDGGRFFYLGVFAITRSEKFSEKAFKTITYAIGIIFLLIVFFWAIALF